MSTYVKSRLGFIASGLGTLLLAAGSPDGALAMPVRKAHTPFVVHGCPWECCAFGEVSVAQATALYDKPEGRKVVGRVRPGELITIEAADELVHPLQLTVVFPHGPFKTGEVVFTGGHIAECGLDYEGRGDNEDCLSELEVTELVNCKGPASAKCWAQVSGKPADAFTVWVRVRTQKGKVGWTKEDSVPAKDLCS